MSGMLESAPQPLVPWVATHREEDGKAPVCNASGVAPFFVVVKYFESLPPELPWVALRTAFIERERETKRTINAAFSGLV